MTDPGMNFHATAPRIPPRILCIGMPVRDLTFRVSGLPARGSKEHASHFDEISGGNALNAAIGIVRLGGRASICGPMGDAGEMSSRYILDKLAEEGIESKYIVRVKAKPLSSIALTAWSVALVTSRVKCSPFSVIAAMTPPLFSDRIPFQKFSRPRPMQVMGPIPVMTARLRLIR